MRVAVSCDSEGRIVTMFDPDRLHHEAAELAYLPRPDEKHYVLDLPKEFEAKSLLDLHTLLRVNFHGVKPVLEPMGKAGQK